MGCCKSLPKEYKSDSHLGNAVSAETLAAMQDEEQRRNRQHITENIVQVEFERGTIKILLIVYFCSYS